MEGKGWTWLLAVLLNADIPLTAFYASGLTSTIGTYEEIPSILGGFLLGSVFFPIAGFMLFTRSLRRVLLSSLSVPLAIGIPWLYVARTLIVTDSIMFVLTFVSTAGQTFVCASTSFRRTGPGAALASGLTGMLLLLSMLLAYAVFFDTMLPIIILLSYAVTAALLIYIAVKGRGRERSGY
ncbi:MAG: hypothetical protein QXP70_02860 [Methanomassiliicoccales archaeon]